MTYFTLTNSTNRKVTFSSGIILTFVVALFLFFSNKNIFANYKSYYFKSYSYIIPYNLKEMVSGSHVLGSSPLASAPFAKSVPVLLYHGLLGGSTTSNDGEATNITLATFWDQMKTLKEAGWQTITMQDFQDYMQGKKQLPAKSFLLTFDDGRKDSYYPSDPIFRSLNYHAVMFVIDQYSLEENSHYYLSKDELKKMVKSKEWEIQSHGYSSHSNYQISEDGEKGHFFSNKLWLQNLGRLETETEFIERTTKDLQLAKENLEETFGKPIIAFAFPFGDYGYSTINYPGSESIIVPLAKSIYPLTFYQYSNIYRYSQNSPNPNDEGSPLMIRRISISPTWNGEKLLQIFQSGDAKKLPFDASFTEEEGWINTNWGTLTLKNNKLNIASIPSGTGSTVVLDGSESWVDYEVTAKVKWIKGSNIYLSARYLDDRNLAACNFKKDLVHVEQILDGEQRVIAGATNEFNPGQEIFTIGIRVIGRKVECSIDGKVITSTNFLDPALSFGGIGIKTWDVNPGNSEMEVESLSVNNLQ